VSVALLGGERLPREAIAEVLSAQPGLRIVGGFGSAAECRRALAGRLPDVLLVDCEGLGLGRWQGVVASLRAPGIETRVALLCAELRPASVSSVLEQLVAGVFLKSSSAEEVAAGLVEIAAGGTVLPLGWEDAVRPPEPAVRLSLRHRQILGLIADGARNEEIATLLELSPNTVKFHLRVLYERLGVRNRVQAARTLDPAGIACEELLAEPPAELARLSRREREVLELASEGLSNREIADRLIISANTVKFHLGNAYARLGVRGRVEAAGAVREHAVAEPLAPTLP
jgi:two-component system nitrate/nitrite response regulator NarL